MRILVTGASGLLGVNLALEAARQHEVVGVVNQNLLNTSAFDIRQMDLTQGVEPGSSLIEDLLADIRPDWVIHCAAQANIDVCEKEPDLARRQNVEVPRRLAQAVHTAQGRYTNGAAGGPRLLHVSTDAVFDGLLPLEAGGYSESDPTNPQGVYAFTKLEAEQAVQQADPSALVVRVNLIGWSTSGKRSLAEFFYTNLSAGIPIRGFRDIYFCPLLVNDLAHIFIQMLELRLNGLYHAFSRDCSSKYDFGVAVAQRFGFDPGLISPISVNDARLSAARSPNLNMRTDKLALALNRPLPSWRDSLDKFYQLQMEGYPASLLDMQVH